MSIQREINIFLGETNFHTFHVNCEISAKKSKRKFQLSVIRSAAFNFSGSQTQYFHKHNFLFLNLIPLNWVLLQA